MRILKDKNGNPNRYNIEDVTLSDLVVLKKAVEDFHTKAEDIRTMDSVESLTGIWSVDFILEDDRIWLIDMAQGYRSTYWDKEKIIRMFPNRYA